MNNKKPNQLTFQDYFHIRKLAEKDNLPLKPEITKFNDTQLSYQNAYVMFSEMMDSLTTYSDVYGSMSMDVLSYLVALLNEKQILTNNDIKAIKQVVEQEGAIDNGK